MVKLKYFSLLAMAGIFAACSDNIEVNGSNTGVDNSSSSEGYVRIAINTPTTKGNVSRASDDQDNSPDINFSDGIAEEYNINDGVIVFFKTISEEGSKNPDENATFVSAYNLSGLTDQVDPSGQVTNKVVTVSEAPMVNAKKGESLYALVILNKPSTIVVGTDHSLTIKDGSGSEGNKLDGTSKLSAFTKALENQSLATYVGTGFNAFTMLNAPLSTVPGTSMSNATAKTLVPVTVYDTKNEAMSNAATRIYVERLVAKVTLSGFTYASSEYTKQVTDVNGIYSDDVVKLEGWILNVTNKSTKLVRDVSGYNTNDWLAASTSTANNEISRFAGTELIPVDYDGTNYYRIYWAEDGNYDSAEKTDFTIYYTDKESENSIPDSKAWNTQTSDNTSDNTKDYAIYCFENTMNFGQQKQGQTTAVLLKTSYMTKFGTQLNASAQDFFICGANPTKYPGDKNIEASDGGNVKDIVSFVVEEANKVLLDGSKIGPDDLSLNGNASAGIYDSKDKIKTLFTLKSADDNKWDAIWNQIGTIRYYKGGVSYYYAAFIRHFYNDETPWNNGETYGVHHLGRYGVVRNNWYEINVSNITGPGEPVIVEPDQDEPDDNAEGYIRAEINVLAWAKRLQNVDL